MPSSDRLAFLALRTLEEALAQAASGPVERTWGQRLALAWLSHIGAAKDGQCANFWKVLADEYSWACTEEYSRDMRTTILSGCLDHWYLELGLERPCLVQRGKWAQRCRDVKPERADETLPPRSL